MRGGLSEKTGVMLGVGWGNVAMDRYPIEWRRVEMIPVSSCCGTEISFSWKGL